MVQVHAWGHELEVTQAEVAYINLVQAPSLSAAQGWFTFLDTTPFNLERANVNLVEVLSDGAGRPNARFFHELVTVQMPDSRERAFQFTLTIRGAPRDGSLRPRSTSS